MGVLNWYVNLIIEVVNCKQLISVVSLFCWPYPYVEWMVLK